MADEPDRSAPDLELTDWTCAATPAGAVADPAGLPAAGPEWLELTVPGTAAAALLAADHLAAHPLAAYPLAVRGRDLDAEDWWFRTTFERPPGEGWDLLLDGLATVADVWVNGTAVLHSDSMFRSHRIDLDGLLEGANELVIRCAALHPLLAARRRPRPRWKARLPSDQGLRWFRTTLYGRSPSWTPDLAPVGPWRPVRLRRRAAVEVLERRVHPHLDGDDGVVDVRFVLGSVPADLRADLVVGEARVALAVEPHGGGATASGRLTIPGVERWWPATHGAQPRLEAHLAVTADGRTTTVALGRIGFRTIEFDRADGPVLRVNGVPVFCRGACWAPLDPVGLTSDPALLRAALQQVRDAGMNMVRLQGTMVPETEAFHDLCDELGILVWHDLMFATLDYPSEDEGFLAEVGAELHELFDRLQLHPSTAVVCGGSEVQQQAAMLGRDVGEATDPLFEGVIPAIVADRLAGVPYWPGSPTWTGRAFGVDTGVAHYFGVGGYLRPLTDARTSGVRFASECLAFSCVPGDATVAALRRAGVVVGNGPWKAGVPRDAGRAWDFEDVRDHYVRDRFAVDPGLVRAVDPDHYLDLGRAAVAEVMAATLAEWRRPGSPCQGAVILQQRDLLPGAGFGLVDHRGLPKSVWYALRRVLQPVALLTTDEGVNGLDIHALNDGPEPRTGSLTVRAFAGPNVVAEGEVACTVPARSGRTFRADAVLGGFYDLTWAYRFGPRAIDAVSATWQTDGAEPVHTVFLPGGEPLHRGDTGLAATARAIDDTTQELSITTQVVARCVLIDAPGAVVSDDAFDLVPGRVATVTVEQAGPVPVGLRCVNGRYPTTATAAH